jgi:hypothetical protein
MGNACLIAERLQMADLGTEAKSRRKISAPHLLPGAKACLPARAGCDLIVSGLRLL